MFGADSDSAWEKYGRIDPYFGVYSSADYKRENLNEEPLSEFFRSGEEHATLAFKRALDFGCGVGRMTTPIARVCPNVVGVDASDFMLKEARRNCDVHGIDNVEPVGSGDRLSRVSGGFDFVHAFVVFQRLPSRRGEGLLREIVARLSEGGVGAPHEKRCGHLCVRLTNHGGHLGIIVFFQKGVAAPWPMEHGVRP